MHKNCCAIVVVRFLPARRRCYVTSAVRSFRFLRDRGFGVMLRVTQRVSALASAAGPPTTVTAFWAVTAHWAVTACWAAFWEPIDAQYGDPVPVFGERIVDALDDVALVELIVQLEPDASLARARDTRCLSPICEMPARRCDLDHRIKTHARWHPHRDTDRTTIWTTPTGHQYTCQTDPPPGAEPPLTWHTPPPTPLLTHEPRAGRVVAPSCPNVVPWCRGAVARWWCGAGGQVGSATRWGRAVCTVNGPLVVVVVAVPVMGCQVG